jgi:hypothetical protein
MTYKVSGVTSVALVLETLTFEFDSVKMFQNLVPVIHKNFVVEVYHLNNKARPTSVSYHSTLNYLCSLYSIVKYLTKPTRRAPQLVNHCIEQLKSSSSVRSRTLRISVACPASDSVQVCYL